jgi:hypothetical protein
MSIDINAVAQILIASSSMVLSAVVFYHTRKTAALESLRAVRDSWMQLDTLALTDDKTLRIADHLFNPNAKPDIEQARKRWILLAALNPVVSDFMAARAGVTPSAADTIAGCRAMLGALLQDDDAYALTQGGSYTGPFQQLCGEVRAELVAATRTATAGQSA